MKENDLKSKYPVKKIRICKGSSCTNNFCADTIRITEEYFGKKLDKNFPHDDVILESTGCQSFCEFGPNILVDEEVFHGMTTKKMKKLLQEKFPPKQPTKKNEYGLETIADLLNLS